MEFKKSFISLIGLCLILPLFFTFCKEEDKILKPANAFLSSKDYDKLRVEIQSMVGFEPTQGTLDNLKTFLEARLNKPGGITFLQTSIPASGKSSYSVKDIEAIEKANRTSKENYSGITAYILFLDGDFSENAGDSKVLGIAYGSSSMTIFEKTIKEFSGGLTKPSATTLETTVVNHEFGHILGLVNNGTAMQTPHQDEPNGRHCNNKDCLMYFTAESSDIIGNLLGNTIPQLDNNCINDLKANGGK